MIGIIFRVLLTILIAFYITKIFLKFLAYSKKNNIFKDSNSKYNINKDNVIDLCPKCGKVLKDHHSCEKSS